MNERVSVGIVPTAPLRPILEHLIKQRFPFAGSAGLARKADLDESIIRRTLGGEVAVIEFDTADKMLVALGSPMSWHSPELEDIYQSVDLLTQRCEGPGCERLFVPKVQEGPRRHRYCSKSCGLAAANQRRGASTRRFRKGGRKGYCWMGHKLTPENTVIPAEGRKQCRQCRNKTQRERRARQRQQQKVAA